MVYGESAARRPTHTVVTRPDSTTFTAARTVYGETAPTPTASNLRRGQVFRVYDGAGLVEHEAFDVDGNLVRQSRRLAAAYDMTPDWAATGDLADPSAMDAATAGMLEAETFTTEQSFDAMGRPVAKTTPDASVLHLGYGDAGHLETVAANVRGDVTQTSFVTDLRYNARGQRTLVVYGNGTQTSYAYDPLTFQLTQLRTERTADGHPHQDLRYSFDPVGNITEIRDLAQPVVFTSNAAISADQRFEYDALYRLVHAEGREHQSQGQPTADDFIPRAAPEDPTGLRAYTEQYLYDAVGNILQMQHAAVGGSWTRHYSYDPATSGNRLLATNAPGDAPGTYSHAYAHDAHGSMTAMPHLAAIGWDWADRMQSADLGGGGTVHFTYDATGQRVRKIRVNQAGTSTWERIYLGGFELYRERVGTELRLERETLHVGDDAGRVCLVETKTIDDALPIATPATISRYQYANHLGTVGLELDETGQLISYEEFHPYGTTAYRAANSTIEVSPSRYRYTGKERDEETGLGYHGVRYYASWLGRWTAADPIGLGDGVNRFAYVGGNPIRKMDPSGMAGSSSEEVTVTMIVPQEGETHAQLAGRAIQTAFCGIDDSERAQIEQALDGAAFSDDITPGQEHAFVMTPHQIESYERIFDAKLRNSGATTPDEHLATEGILSLHEATEPNDQTAQDDLEPSASAPPNERRATHNAAPAGFGLFSHLRYTLFHSINHPVTGDPHRFNFTFRDMTGFSDPTSHAYFNRTRPAPGNYWKGLRLDHGPTPGTTVSSWHWNHKGGGAFGVADHTPASRGTASLGRAVAMAKGAGRLALGIGIIIDAYSLASSVHQGVRTGDWSIAAAEAVRIAAAWTTAALAAKAGGAIGASIGFMIGGPVGAIVGAFVGSIIGGIFGYSAGSNAADSLMSR